jgi:4-aminobutyrate aminotransferase-like enzyme
VRALEAAGIAKLEAMRERHVSIGDVRAVGCFMAIEFVKDRETKERDPELQERVAWAAIRRGVLADPSTTSLNVQPSLVTSVEVLERGLDLIDEAIAEATGV